jgi:N-acetylmuramoyl-L-alanine amidase
MSQRALPLRATATRARRYWPFLAVLLLALLVAFTGHTAWAADGTARISQTVPPVTPQPDVPPPPEPTPAPDDADGGSATTPPAATGQTPPPAASGEAATGPTATVTAPVLNLRSGPGTSFAVAGKLKSGDTLTVLGRNAAGDWLYVCCLPDTETRGWVSAEFVTPAFAAADLPALADDGTPGAAPAPPAAESAPPAVAPAPALGKTATVTATVLNVRAGPGTTFSVIGKLRNGATVDVQGRNAGGDWLYMCCVPATETRGWVSAEYVSPAFASTDLPEVADDGTPGAGSEAGAVSTTEGVTGTVTATVLNVRAAPGTTNPVVGKLRMGSVIGVQGRNAASDWLYMCCVPATETKGWVSAEYIAPVFPPEALPPLNDDGTPAAP